MLNSPTAIKPATNFPRTNIEEVLKRNRENNSFVMTSNFEVDPDSMLKDSKKSFYSGVQVAITFPKFGTQLVGTLKEINQDTNQLDIWLSNVSVISFVDVQCIWGDHKESPVEITLNDEKMLRFLYPDSFQGEITKEKEESIDCRFTFRYLLSI
jgi:hypothetical protein